MSRPSDNTYRTIGPVLIVLAMLLGHALGATRAHAQVPSVAFVDDSTLAAETLDQLDELVQAGSVAEAARALQRLLDDEADRVLGVPGNETRFIPVRAAVHDALRARPALLEAYADQQAPEAERLLEAGAHLLVERSRLFTRPGYEAALRVAQEHMEAARFHIAWRTVQQLSDHPFPAGRHPQAARLARRIASYLDHDATTALRDWARRAGPPEEPVEVVRPPTGLGAGDLPALAGTGPLDLDGIVPSPLQTSTLPAAESWAGQGTRGIFQRSFWAIPAVSDADMFINDGTAVVAYDRFTLRRLWRTPNAEAPTEVSAQAAKRNRNRTRQIEDAGTVTLHDGSVYAALGVVISGRREGDDRVVRLDARTGTPEWVVTPSDIAPELAGASARGPIAVDGDTAVFSLRKSERSRRTVAIYLAGLDIRDGSLRWNRPVGSVGALPYQQQIRAAQAPVIHRGVAVLVDEVGLIAAIDAATGRPLWLHRGQPLIDNNAQALPYAVHSPVHDGDDIVLLSPDRRTIRRIDLLTGVTGRSRPTVDLDAPHYLARVGGTDNPEAEDSLLAVMGRGSVSFIDPDSLETRHGPIAIANRFGEITGRALPAGDRLLVPVDAGVVVIDPDADTEAQARRINIDSTGNIAAASGQLLVADDTMLRSYLVWDVAAELLRERIDAEPDNPSAAVTFAELAHKAGRPEAILPAIDAAIDALERAVPGAESRASTDRLFDVTLGMVDAAHERWLGAPEETDNPEAVTVSAEIAEQLVDRLGRLADSPEHRVAYLLAAGRQHEARESFHDAAETYQRLLADPRLAVTSWRGPRVSIRADLEATRRLHGLVGRAGYRVYAPFDQLAAEALAALGPSPTPDQLESLARTYPLSPSAILARLSQADALQARGLTRQAARAGGRALDIIRRLTDNSVSLDPALVGRAYGAQVLALAEANRLEEAAGLVSEVRRGFPALTLLDGETTLETDAVFEEITRRLAQRRTLPRFGSALAMEDEPQLLQGYVLRPLARAEPGGVSRARFDGVLVVSPPEGTLAWHHAESPDAPLAEAWSRQIDRDPLLLRTDEVSAWLFWPDETGGWLERIDLTDGTPLWTSAPWIDLIEGVSPPDENDREPARTRFVDGLGNRARAEQLLITMDSRTLVLVERGGRAAAVDVATGRNLWNAALPVSRVHDVDTAAGVLAVGGLGVDRQGQLGPVLATIDPRTGEPIHTDESIERPILWTRVTGGGELIVGLRNRILSISPAEGSLNWVKADPAITQTDNARLIGRTLMVQDTDDFIWLIDTETGRATDDPLETRGRIDTADRVVAERIADRLVLSSTDGVCVFDQNGALVGVDAFTQPARVMPAVVSENTLAVLKIEQGRFGLGGTRYVMNMLSPTSGKLEASFRVQLYGEPSAVIGMDDRLLISAGEATLVLKAPAE